MDRVSKILFLPLLLILGCNDSVKEQLPPLEQQTSDSIEKAEIDELTKLTKAVYLWYETTGNKTPDFNYISKDSIYIGIDTNALKSRKNELLNTGLFSTHFIKNISIIGEMITGKLKHPSIKYYVGEISPFGNGGNPWTNTQDTPDKYWEIITLNNITFHTDSANFTWTWGDNYMYHIQAVKESGKWKINTLEGFYPENFIGT